MLRLATSLLSLQNGKYVYQNQPFTGIGYNLIDEVVESIALYREGHRAENYTNEYLPITTEKLRIDSEALEPENEDDYEPLMCYEGQRFSGIAYDFQNNICTGELIYRKGQLESSVTYYISGALEFAEIIDEKILQRYQWYSNAAIKRFEIYDKNVFEITLAFEDSGQINCLSINGNYFDRVQQIADQLKLKLFLDQSFVSNLKSADALFLQGSEIKDELFNQLIERHVLDETSLLRISKTLLTDESFKKLGLLQNLKELQIDSSAISEAAVTYLKKMNSRLEIEFNS